MKTPYKRESHYYIPHRKMSLLILLLLISFQIFFVIDDDCLGQQSITWQRVYDGDGPGNFSDGGFDACDACDGNFFLVGHTDSSASNRKIWVLKINAYGDTIWSRKVGNGIARCVTPSGDGGCVLSGDLGEANTIKLNNEGIISWFKIYGGYTVQIYRIIKTIDNGYLACGRENFSNAIAFKIDSIGNLEWLKIFPSMYTKNFRDVKQTDNGYILVGNIAETTLDTLKILVSKLDNFGNLIWERKYKVQNRRATGGSIFISGTNYIIGGGTTDSSVSIAHNYIMKTDTAGNVYFVKIFTSVVSESFKTMNLVNDNRYIIALSRNYITSIYGKARMIDSSGNIIIEKEFPTPSFIEFRSVLIIPNSDILLFGTAEFCEYDCEDFYAVRTDSNLTLPPFIGINNQNTNIPDYIHIYQNFPNPFNPITIIKYEVNKPQRIQINLYDIQGRLISGLKNEFHYSGSYSLNLNANDYNLSSGLYLAELISSSGYQKSIKILLIK